MTRLAVIFIVACTLLRSLFFVWKSAAAQQDEEVARNKLREDTKGAVVFAIRDIAQGETITADAIELREIPQSQIPCDACGEISMPTGKKARYGFNRGQIVAIHDLAPYPPGYIKTMVRAVKEIPAGADIKADAIEEIELPLPHRTSKRAPLRSSDAIGKKAIIKIRPGQLVEASDIVP
jgi:flagella basal body P-ring formation protein FlgA